MGSKITHWVLRLWTLGVMFFLLAPLVVIIVYSFNESNIQSWPIRGFSLKWMVAAWNNEEIFTALGLSLKIALLATVISVFLGTAAAFVVDRYRFFGREMVSFIVVLPIALPACGGYQDRCGKHPWTLAQVRSAHFIVLPCH